MPPCDDDITFFAETDFRGVRRRFGIRRADRRNHMLILGRTGMGKSTLLEGLIASDLRAGNGLLLLDPHGDLAERVRRAAAAIRADDLIDFDPAHQPVGYNPLWVEDSERRYLAVAGLVAAFRKIWEESWGPRLEHILRHALLTLAEFPGATLVDLPRLLTDPAFRKTVVGRVTDAHVRTFWQQEFDRYAQNLRVEAVAPILNKIGAVLASPVIREVVGVRSGGLDLRAAMDGCKVVVADLAKGRLGEDASTLLGALLVGGVEQAALSRANLPEEQRVDFYLYIDEVASFATQSLVSLLQEARKYRVSLTLAAQHLEPLGEELEQSLLGNVGTLVTFRVGVRDAKILADEFFPEFSLEDLVNLARGRVYLRLMIDGVVSRGFSARTKSGPSTG
jgi:hypothetical protein